VGGGGWGWRWRWKSDSKAYVSAVSLPIVDGMVPDSRLLLKSIYLRNSAGRHDAAQSIRNTRRSRARLRPNTGRGCVRTQARSGFRCCQESCRACFANTYPASHCAKAPTHHRGHECPRDDNVRAAAQQHRLRNTGRDHTHTLMPEHVTALHLSSHGSLPAAWFRQPLLPLLHELPLVAMYRSTSAARCSGAAGATAPTRILQPATSTRRE
jgi:hypothetical protein